MSERSELLGFSRPFGLVGRARELLSSEVRPAQVRPREVAAEAMDSTLSNVDNLQRRAAEKLADAERVRDGVDALRVADRALDGSQADEGP